MPIYTYANLQDDVQRDASNVTNITRILNRAAMTVVSDIDLRSTKRRVGSTPLMLNEDLFDYQAPSDLKEFALIDIRRGVDRHTTDKLNMVTNEYFDRYKALNRNLVTIEDADFFKKLRISAELRGVDGKQATLHEMDSLTGNGTWSVNLDASNLTLDEDVFLHGSASLNFDMDQTGTTVTAGTIVNSDMDAVDLTGYEDAEIFMYTYAPLVVGLDGYTLRMGSSSANYFELQVTTTNEGLAFHKGWMLLKFDLKKATETGTVDLTAINYLRVTIDKGNDSLQSKDWRMDYIVARRGIYHDILYYTKFPWQTVAGAYIENSTLNTDLLNADTEEYELFVLKGQEYLARDQGNFVEMREYQRLYLEGKERYEMNAPSERILFVQDYRNFIDRPDEVFMDETNSINN